MAITQQLTLEECLKLPEEKPALEYLHGMVTQKMSPRFRHSILQLLSGERINGFARPRRLAIALPELRTTYAGASTVPDVAVFVWERIARDANGEPLDEVVVPPDIAIEIASPSQSLRPLTSKCAWYVEHGVRVALLIRPNDQSIAVFRSGAEVVTRRGA